MSGNAGLFLGIFIFIFIVWVITGGPSKPISFSGPYLHSITGPGQTTESYTLGKGSTSSTTQSGSNGFNDLEQQIDDLSSYGETSSYRGLVTINRSPSGPRSTNVQEEYVSVSVSRRATEAVTLTGWKLESMATGITAVIPTGVVVPYSGTLNQVSSITVTPGETVIVTSGRSPIGTSFRENLCTGYLSEFQPFTPDLTQACPTAHESFVDRYENQNDQQCENYTWQVPRCSAVTHAPSEVSNDCDDFLESINYNSCVSEFSGASDFAGNTWRVFLGSNQELWRENHETIRLIDAVGKTVDVLAY